MPFDLMITDKTPRTLLSQTQLFDLVPAAFQPSPAPKTSKNYDFVDTMQAVDILQSNGFKPVYAAQKPSRKSGNIPFASHLIAFAKDIEKEAPHKPEILLWNSHDASQSLRLLCGIYRIACDNGCVMGEGFQAKLRHDGGQTAGFEKLVQDQAKNMTKAMDQAEKMQAVKLDMRQQQAFAKDALNLRWGNINETAENGTFWDSVTMIHANHAKRIEDTSQDLWTTYNRLQESLITANNIPVISRTEKGEKPRKAKAIQSLKETVRLNQGLWDLAEKVAA